MEVLGIGLIIPLISTLIEDNNSFIDIISSPVRDYLNFNDKISLLIFICIFICIFFIIKNFFLILTNYYLSKFYYEIKNKLVKKLYKSYITQEYNDFIKFSSSKRISNVVTETQNVLEGTIMPFMTLVAELFLLISICSLLLLYNFEVTIIAISVLLLITLFILFIIKPILKRYGIIRFKHHQNKVELVNQSINGIREIKLFQMGKNIVKIFNLNNDELSKVSFKHIFIQSITKYYIEIGAIISFVLVVIFYLKFNSNSKDLITLLSLYGVSIFRIMPSLNKIINAKNSMRFSELPTQRILEDLSFIKKEEFIEKNKEFNNNIFKNWSQIEFKNLNYNYDESNHVIKNLNLKISNGEKIGIIGKSGSGKSTLIDLICNLLEPKKGEIFIDGNILDKKNRDNYLNLFSYVSQNTFIFNTTLEKNITLNFSNNTDQFQDIKFEKATTIAQLDEFINTLSQKNNQIIGEEGNRLSGGQKQRVGIARSIYADRQIIIFDEATSALDEKTENNFISSLLDNFKDKTILFVTHKKHLIKKFNSVYEFDETGKISKKNYDI